MDTPQNSPRISPDCSAIISDGKKFRFRKWWSNPKQMINRPYLSVWSLNVHTYDQLMEALDSAHSLNCVHSLSFMYADNHFEGTCVVPNSEI